MKFIKEIISAMSFDSMVRATAFSFIIQGVGAVLVLIVELLLARLLGLAQFSIYATVAAWIYLLGLMATLGLNQLLLRFVPTYLAKNEISSLKGVVRRSNVWVLLSSTAIIFLGTITLKIFNVSEILFLPFIIALISIPFLALSSLRQAVLRGLGKFTHALLPDFILKPLLFITFLGCFVGFSNQNITVVNALVLSLLATFIAFGVGTFWQHKYLPFGIKKATAAYYNREWFLVAMPLLSVIGLNLISYRIDIVMLGLIAGVKDVGTYSAASRISDVVVFGLVSANAVVVPTIAKLFSSNKLVELQAILKRASKGILLFTLPFAIIILIFGREILDLFGPGFSEGYYPLVILVLGHTFSVLAGPVGAIMMMTGHQNSMAKIASISAVINLSLSVMLIHFFGMIGAAISTCVSLLALNFLMLRFVKKTLLIEPTIFNSIAIRTKNE
jgi:O-antigen/teichoic acid export membrane protein